MRGLLGLTVGGRCRGTEGGGPHGVGRRGLHLSAVDVPARVEREGLHLLGHVMLGLQGVAHYHRLLDTASHRGGPPGHHHGLTLAAGHRGHPLEDLASVDVGVRRQGRWRGGAPGRGGRGIVGTSGRRERRRRVLSGGSLTRHHLGPRREGRSSSGTITSEEGRSEWREW